MKKKSLLKAVAAVTPLVGVLAPLTSCVTNNAPKLLKIESNNDNVQTWLPIMVMKMGDQTIKADRPLPVPDPEEEPIGIQKINLICNNPSYILTEIDCVIVETSTGHVTLDPNTDYYLDDAPTESLFSTICFTTDGISRIADSSPVFIIIKPKKIIPVSCTITVSDPVSYCTEPEIHHHDITQGFIKTFEIKSDYEDQYQYDEDLMHLGFHVWFGNGQFKEKYKEIDPKYYSVNVYTKNNITFELKPDLDLTQFPSNSNNFIFDIPYCGKYVYGATVKLFDNDQIMSVPNLFEKGQTDFGIRVPKSLCHRKKALKAQWKYDKDGAQWQDCEIEEPSQLSDSVIIKSKDDQILSIYHNIIINVTDVGPIQPEDTFENESWADLGFWVHKVYDLYDQDPETDDQNRAAKLCQIYNVQNFDDFLGKEKTVSWDYIDHKVVVASTFQLNTPKPEHEDDLILNPDTEIDFKHHAAFVFQFKNLLTGVNSEGKPYVAKNRFDNNIDQDSNCWVERDWHDTKFITSDIRNFFTTNGDKGFRYRLSGDSEALLDYVTPIASDHFTRSQNVSENYICDRFFIPTSVQMNGIKHTDNPPDSIYCHKMSERDGDPAFKLYARECEPTDDPCEFRQFKPAVDSLKAAAYWLCSPCGYQVFVTDNNMVVLPSGEVDTYDHDTGRALLPCFCL